MPSTVHGWPYPDGTAKIGQLHTKIQDVAAALERRIQGGAVAYVSATGTVDIAVVFPVAFTNVPTLTQGHNQNNVTSLLHQSLTNTGFLCRVVRNASGGSVSARWLAFDYTS